MIAVLADGVANTYQNTYGGYYADNWGWSDSTQVVTV
jgi:hypothetical protein